MDDGCTTLELAYVIKELSSAIGKHFSKFYYHGEDIYRIKLQDVNITLKLGKFLCLTRAVPEQSISVNAVQFARKTLKNQVLHHIFLLNFDRIVLFSFEQHNLIFEMFREGNIIITDKSNTIAYVLKRGKWSNRELRVGVQYQPPPSRFSPDFEKMFSSKKYVVAALTPTNIGTKYIKHILSTCQIDEKTPANQLTEDQKRAIKTQFFKLLDNLSPSIEDNTFALYPLKKPASTLSECIEACLLTTLKKPKKQSKLERIIANQQQTYETLGTQIANEEQKIRWLEKHQTLIEQILLLYKSVKLDEFEQKITTYLQNPTHKKILGLDKFELNKAQKTLILNLKDQTK